MFAEFLRERVANLKSEKGRIVELRNEISHARDAANKQRNLPVFIDVVEAEAWGNIGSTSRPTIRSELTAASTRDQVHACQMMTEVHTVSIIAKKTYAG
jgi:hypothetical protein